MKGNYLEVFSTKAGEPGYDLVRSGFPLVEGNPPMTGITLPTPRKKKLSEQDFIVLRYCLDRILAGQSCKTTNNGPIDLDRFFDGYSITGYEQIHLLAHLVLANRVDLTNDPHVHDRLFEDEESVQLWFSAEFPPHKFRVRVCELQRDLDALFGGEIQGWIAKAVIP